MAKIDKSVQITLIIIAGIIILAMMGYAAFQSIIPATNTVTGNGEATIKAVPDLVGVYFNIETTGKTSQEAKDANSEIFSDLKTSLLNKGFSKEEIQTQNFNVYPDYEWVNGKRIQKGYKATHSIKVEFSTKDSEKISEVIDAGVDAGAGISYINFELSQELQNQYKAEALKLASQDARIKAESIAIGLEKKLGKLVSVSSSDFGYRPWILYETREDATVSEIAKEATEEVAGIEPSEKDITARVTAVFKLK